MGDPGYLCQGRICRGDDAVGIESEDSHWRVFEDVLVKAIGPFDLRGLFANPLPELFLDRLSRFRAFKSMGLYLLSGPN